MRIKHFIVTGDPQGKGRPKWGRGHMRTPPKTAQYEAWVKLSYNMQCGDKSPLEGEIKAYIVAYFKPPKSASKSVKKDMYEGKVRPTKKPDIDNITKVIYDSLNGLAYRDDSAIVFEQVAKKYTASPDELPRVEVTLVGR